MPFGKKFQSIFAVRAAKEEAAKEAVAKALKDAAAALEATKITKLKLENADPSPEDLVDLLNWIYRVPYSRRLTFVPRDFSDGVLVAEIVKYFAPHIVDLHNYPPANGRPNKILNWQILNRKVFLQLGFRLEDSLIEQLTAPKRFNVHENTAKCYPIEKVLLHLRKKLGKINDKVFNYDEENSLISIDPFKKKPRSRILRPLSRQPMSEVMWKIEREAAQKFGKYKGNPIAWDNDAIYNSDAELALASIGITKQKLKKFKELKREARFLKQSKNSSSINNKWDNSESRNNPEFRENVEVEQCHRMNEIRKEEQPSHLVYEAKSCPAICVNDP